MTGSKVRILGTLAGGLVALLVPVMVFYSRDPEGARMALAVLVGTALLAALAWLRPGRSTIYTGGILLLVCFDMFTFAKGFNPHADPEALFPRTPLTEFIRRDGASDMTRGGRAMTIGWTMRPETQMVYRIYSIEGYDAMEFTWYREMADRADVAGVHETGLITPSERPLLDLMGLRYIVTPPGGVVAGEGLSLGYDGPDGRVFVNADAQPRLSFVDRAVVPPDSAQALEMLARGDIDTSSEVLLDTDMPGGDHDAGGDPVPEVILERNWSAALTVTVRGHGRPGWLVVDDAWDHGWIATVNGEQAPVMRANHAFRAVPLPAEDVEVELIYRPGSFRSGLWVSVFAMLVILPVGVARWGKDRARPS